jgi:hypothetical protein
MTGWPDHHVRSRWICSPSAVTAAAPEGVGRPMLRTASWLVGAPAPSVTTSRWPAKASRLAAIFASSARCRFGMASAFEVSVMLLVLAASHVSRVHISYDGGPAITSRCTETRSKPSCSACRATCTGSTSPMDVCRFRPNRGTAVPIIHCFCAVGPYGRSRSGPGGARGAVGGPPRRPGDRPSSPASAARRWRGTARAAPRRAAEILC